MLKACGRKKRKNIQSYSIEGFDFSLPSFFSHFFFFFFSSLFCLCECVFFQKIFLCMRRHRCVSTLLKLLLLPSSMHAYMRKKNNVKCLIGKKKCPEDICFFFLLSLSLIVRVALSWMVTGHWHVEWKAMYWTICLLVVYWNRLVFLWSSIDDKEKKRRREYKTTNDFVFLLVCKHCWQSFEFEIL